MWIDAGENSKIIFEIMNEGRKPVYNVVPVVETVGKVKHLGISFGDDRGNPSGRRYPLHCPRFMRAKG